MTFLFGFFVPFFRKNWFIGIISLIITIFLFDSHFFLFIVIQTAFSSIYNKMYIKHLINKGWEPSDKTDEKILTEKGIIFSKEKNSCFLKTETEISEYNKYDENFQNTQKALFKQIKNRKTDTAKNIFISFRNNNCKKIKLH